MRISNGAGPRQEKAPKPDLQSVLLYYGLDVNHSGNYTCIFHSETRASMSVNLDESVVQCFSCGEAGDSWSIIQKKEGLDFRESIAFAANAGFEDAAPERGGEDVPSVLGRKRAGVPRNKGDRRSSRWQRPW